MCQFIGLKQNYQSLKNPIQLSKQARFLEKANDIETDLIEKAQIQ